MDTMPIFLRSNATRALLIGDGPQTTAKARILLQADIRITVLGNNAPCDSLQQLIDREGLTLLTKHFETEDLDHHDMVVVADMSAADAAQIAAAARRRHIPVNVVDRPELCSFYFAAMVEREPMVVAIGSQGQAPVLSHYLRRKIEQSLPAQLGELAPLIREYRERVKALIPSASERLVFWEALLDGPLAGGAGGSGAEAAQLVEEALAARADNREINATVYLIGAGPGDPDLLTVKALRLLQQADVVVYDRLVSPAILALSRRDAERIDVGKRMGNHTLPQEEINRLLVRLSREGKRVVRLKGGDPFIFGRGGEEIEELLEENIPFQVVPGITAASGSATYCGIPLTHRDHAQSVTFVTGHLKQGELNLKWESLAQPQQTVVFYMGLTSLPLIAEQLQAHGQASDTPVALVHRATTPHQRLLIGRLDNIADLAREHAFKSPSLIIIGSVVSLAEKLKPEGCVIQ